MSIKSNYLAEVIESSLQSFKSHCWEREKAPAFGSCVVIDVPSDNKIIFGVVHQVYTCSDDPVRSVYAYKKTEEELQKEQPQIFAFLKTIFTAIVLGYKQGAVISQATVLFPAPLHAFVRPATIEECTEFFGQSYYISLLFNQAYQLGNIDELLLAMLNQFQIMGFRDDVLLESFVEQFSLLSGGDYQRLRLFLQRVVR